MGGVRGDGGVVVLLGDGGEEWKSVSTWSSGNGGNGGSARSTWALELMGLPPLFKRGRGGGEEVQGGGQGQRVRFEWFGRVDSGVRRQEALGALARDARG